MDSDAPPLVLDIDGTLTDDPGALDPRAFDVLPEWPAPVVLATGKAFPYPVGLCHYLGIDKNVVAENGGVVLADETVTYTGDRERAQAVAEHCLREHNVIVMVAGTRQRTIRWSPPLIITSDDVDIATSAFADAIRATG